MDILMNNITESSSFSFTYVIGLTATLGFVNYYLMFAVKVSIYLVTFV